jgi:hypothetical protein
MSAVEAALRRFDGVAESPAKATGTHRPRAWGARPQWSLAISASLVAIIGIPAALIAINDRGPPPPTQPRQMAKPTPQAPRRTQFEPTAEPEAAESASPPVATARLEPNRYPVLPDAKSPAQDADRAAAPAAAMASAPPAPPPPSLVAELDSRAETADEQSIIVTGSRIPAPDASRNRAQRKAERDNDGPVAAPDWVLDDPAYRTFLAGLQSAVRADDRTAIARLIAYPLRVNVNGSATLYPDAGAVLRDFDRIFTPSVRQAILSQRFDQLFGRDQGVMIGSGAVWFDHSCRGRRCDRTGPVRITAINP